MPAAGRPTLLRITGVSSVKARRRVVRQRATQPGTLTRISHHLTVEARDRTAITSLRLLTVLEVLFRSDANGSRCLLRSHQMRMGQAAPAKVHLRAPCTDGIFSPVRMPISSRLAALGCYRSTARKSMASLRPSPMKFTASTVTAMAKPGAIQNQGMVERTVDDCASWSMPPQLGVGG